MFEIVVEDHDRGLDKALRAFDQLDGLMMRVGIIGDEQTARYGAVWEARTGWLRDTVDRLNRWIDQQLILLQNDLVAGIDPVKRLEQIGEHLVSEVKAAIASAGLVDTGALIDSIRFEIE